MKIYDHIAYERMTGADTIVLCVHGIQGSPLQFDWIVNHLPNSVDYMCVLLPGHGKSVVKFRTVGEKEWQEYIEKICAKLRSKYKRIIYVGHSMGCLLGINIAALDESVFSSMILLACPLALKPTVKYFKNNYLAIIDNKKQDPYIEAVQKANSVQMKFPLQVLTCVKPYLSLLKLIRISKPQIGRLQMPIVLIHSAEDEIVSGRSLTFFKGLKGVRTVVVSQSGHFMYSQPAKERVLHELELVLNRFACRCL